MPFSVNTFDEHVGKLVGLLRPRSVCDIGPGAGKYSQTVREKAAADGFTTHLTGVEIDASYVDEFDLRNKYDTLIVDDAVNMINNPGVRFDLVIIGDCLEHMRKSDGLDLLNFLIYRSGYICIIYPECYVQDAWQNHAAEAHISTWCLNDFAAWSPQSLTISMQPIFPNIILFLIKGYQVSSTEIVVDMLVP